MAASERYDLRVGDRVQNRQTQQEGRVLNLVALSRDVLLVTIGVLAVGGGSYVARVTEQVRRGQVSGGRWIKAGIESGQNWIQTGQLTQPGAPGAGGTVSQAAVERASRNVEVGPITPQELQRIRDQLLRDHASVLTRAPGGTVHLPFQDYWKAVMQAARELEHRDSRLRGKLTRSLFLLLNGGHLADLTGSDRVLTGHQIEQGVRQELASDRGGGVQRGRERVLKIALGGQRPGESPRKTVAPVPPRVPGMPAPSPIRASIDALTLQNDPREIAQRVYGFKTDVEALQQRLLQEKGDVDRLLSYLTRGGPHGYYQEVVRGRRMTEPLQHLRQFLRGAPLDPGLAKGFGLAEGATGWDLLKQVQRELDQEQRRPGGNPFGIWQRRQGELLQTIKASHPRYRKLVERLERAERTLWNLDDRYRLFSEWVGVASPEELAIQNSDFQLGQRFRFEAELDPFFSNPLREGLAAPPGRLDLFHVTLADRRRRAGAAIRRGGLPSRGGPGVRVAGDDPLFLFRKQLLHGPTPAGAALDPIPKADYTGRLVRKDGMIYRISRVGAPAILTPAQGHYVRSPDLDDLGEPQWLRLDTELQKVLVPEGRYQVFLEPVATRFDLYTTLPFHDGTDVMRLLEQMSGRAFTPEAPTRYAFRIPVAAPGGGSSTQVPIEALLAYLTGDDRVVNRWIGPAAQDEMVSAAHGSTLQAFGARNLDEFRRMAREAGFSRVLETAIPYEQIAAMRDDFDPEGVRSSAWRVIEEELSDPRRAGRYAGQPLPKIVHRLLQAVKRRTADVHLGIEEPVISLADLREGHMGNLQHLVDASRAEEISVAHRDMLNDQIRVDLDDPIAAPDDFTAIRKQLLSEPELQRIPRRVLQLKGRGLTDLEILNEVFGFDGRRAERALELADELVRISRYWMKYKTPELLGELRALAGQAGFYTFEGTPELAELQRDLGRLEQRLTRSKGTNRERIAAEIARREQEFRRSLVAVAAYQEPLQRYLEAAGIDLEQFHRTFTRSEVDALRQGLHPQQIRPAEFARWRAQLDTLLEGVEKYGLEAIAPEFRGHFGTAGGGIGIRLSSRPDDRGEPLIYREGKVWSAADGRLVMPLDRGGTEIAFASSPSERVPPEAQGIWNLTERDLLSPAEARKFERSLLARDLVQNTELGRPQLGIYRGEGAALGFYAQDPIAMDKMLQNTRALIDPRTRGFLSLDVETYTTKTEGGRHMMAEASRRLGRQVAEGEIHNLAIVAYERQGDTFRKSARVLDLAVEGSPYARHAGAVVGTEKELIRHGIDFLQQNRGIVAGHNIGFDMVDSLMRRAEALEFSNKDQNRLRYVAQNRLADSVLLSQAALPGSRAYGLEALAWTHLGKGVENGRLWREAHIARLDAELLGELVNSFQTPEYRQRVNATFKGVTQRVLKAGNILSREVAGTVLWDTAQGQAFEFVGALDPGEASAAMGRVQQALSGLSGTDPGRMFGVALRPLDFTSAAEGALAASTELGDLHLEMYAQPHTFARQFETRFTEVEPDAARQLMDARVKDLARRRIRRMLEGSSAFEEVLLERERYRWATGQQSAAELTERAIQAASPGEREILSRADRWIQRFNGDTRLIQQLREQRQFWEEEMAHHRPVIDFLEQHVQQAGEDGTKEAFRQASLVWRDYMEQSREHLGDFHRLRNVEVPLPERQLSLQVSGLGENRVAIRVGSEELVRQDLDRIALRLARKMGPEGAAGLLGDRQLAGPLEELMEHGNVLWDTELGQNLRQRIWQEQLRPAMQQGFQQLDPKSGGRFQLGAASLEEAVQQLVQQGPALAQEIAEQVPDHLRPRPGTTAALAGLQGLQQQLLGGAVGEHLARLEQGASPLIGLEHRAPANWLGREVADLLQDAAHRSTEERAAFLRTLHQVRRRMSATDAARTERLLREMEGNEWLPAPTSPTRGRGSLRGAASVLDQADRMAEGVETAARTFRPAGPQKAAFQAAELAATHAPLGRMAGLGALALMGSTLLVAGFTAPRPAPEDEEPDGFRSGEAATRHRREVVERRAAQPHRVSVHVFADDPLGMDHREIVQSVHDVLGTHFQAPLPTAQTQVLDQQQRFDRPFLDQLAARLMGDPSA